VTKFLGVAGQRFETHRFADSLLGYVLYRKASMQLKKLIQAAALGIAWSCCLTGIGSAQGEENQGVVKTEDKKQDQKPDSAKDPTKDQTTGLKKDGKRDQNQGGGGGRSNENKDKPGQNSPNTSLLQVLYPPTDIVIQDDNCESRITALAVRSTAKDQDLYGPVIVGGSLQDKDSSAPMPAQMFQLLEKKGREVCDRYSEITADAKITDDLTRSPVFIGVRKDWASAGVYTGSLWIAAKGDSAAQSITFKVVYRPWTAWLWGIAAIVAGASVSWFAVVYVVRQRQMAPNRILIVRLRNFLDDLTRILEGVTNAGAPKPEKTLLHMQQIRDKGLLELLDDKELSVLAGVTVPPTGTVTVIDDIGGVNLIVQNGFARLLDLWNQYKPNPPGTLNTAFDSMDTLGAVAQPLTGLDQKIQSILATVSAPKGGMKAFNELPSEDAIVHQVKTTSVMLDVISLLAVVLLGIYVLIWKNPGFGSSGNYIEALLWGFGLKLGGDVTKLGPSDVRTAFGIKVPSL
jgi:hypothetical protein